MLSVGIVGLPNVGKSTLFNALLKKQQALAANYPFATIEPNVGVVPVPDPRLQKLAEVTANEIASHSLPMTNLPPIKPATVEFYDIAGLVKGASEGAGLGNKFLSHIRQTSIIAHVVRAFVDENVIKEGSVDPKSDYATIQTELMLADIQTVEKTVSNRKLAIGLAKEVYLKLQKTLNEGQPARSVVLSEEEQAIAHELFLLSSKPEIIVLNVSEEDYTKEKIPEIMKNYAEIFSSVIANEVKQSQIHGIASSPASPDPRNNVEGMVVICAKIESELSELSEEEQKQYLADLGLQQSGLERLIQKAYQTLGLISFLTCGEKEVRAWTIEKGMNAQNAAGVIHTDFIKKFIKAEVVSYSDFVQLGGWKKARENGKARLEGKEYIMQDGDVVEFKIGS